MREVGRASQGFFPTPPSVVSYVAQRLDMRPGNGHIVFCDAGCGAGESLHALASQAKGRAILMGVESDRGRADAAKEVFSKHNEPLFRAQQAVMLDAPIESANLLGHVSLLWFNPPYDTLRASGRAETMLLDAVKDWPMAGSGVLIGVLPDYILGNPLKYTPQLVDRFFEVIWVAKFPSVEYTQFRQCVIVARRRRKALPESAQQPAWADNMEAWPTMDTFDAPTVCIEPVAFVPTWRRTTIDEDSAATAMDKSPLHLMLLASAAKPDIPPERPPLPLGNGHLALLLAGGICDGVVNTVNGKFLVKGSCTTTVRKWKTREIYGKTGEIEKLADVYRTHHDLRIRCLRESGRIEEYGTGVEKEDANK